MLTLVKLLPISFDKFKPKDVTWIVQLHNDKNEYVHLLETSDYKAALEKAITWRDFAGIKLEKVKK